MFFGASSVVVAMAALPVFADTLTDEANRDFTYESRPVHPFLIREFTNWVSDYRPPITTAVDVAAASDSNEYAAVVTTDSEGSRCASEDKESGTMTERTTFCYRPLGRLANGAHVLKTMQNAGGSSTFVGLMLVHFEAGSMLWQGRLEPQLRLSVVATQTLKPGTGDVLKLSGNTVLVSSATVSAVTRQQGGKQGASAPAAPVVETMDFSKAVLPTGDTGGPNVAGAGEGVVDEDVVVYRCDSGREISASYDTEADGATVTYQGRTVEMSSAIAASGARYVGGGWVWWTRGDSEGSLFVATPKGDTGASIERCSTDDGDEMKASSGD